MVFDEAVVSLAGHESLQTAEDVLLGKALKRPAGDVVYGRLMPAHADDDDAIERGIGLTMPSSKETVAIRHTARRRNRTDPRTVFAKALSERILVGLSPATIIIFCG